MIDLCIFNCCSGFVVENSQPAPPKDNGNNGLAKMFAQFFSLTSATQSGISIIRYKNAGLLQTSIWSSVLYLVLMQSILYLGPELFKYQYMLKFNLI